MFLILKTSYIEITEYYLYLHDTGRWLLVNKVSCYKCFGGTCVYKNWGATNQYCQRKLIKRMDTAFKQGSLLSKNKFGSWVRIVRFL